MALSSESVRDVINVKALSSALLERAKEKGLADTVQQWLGKQFCNWLSKNFAHMTKVPNAAMFETLTGQSAPEWFIAKFQNTKDVAWYIDPDHEQLLQIEGRLVEWLEPRAKTDLARKFPRMTAPQILAKWNADHRRFQREQTLGRKKTTGEALKTLFEVDGLAVCEFIPSHAEFRAELFNESQMMQHCVGQFDNRENLVGGSGDYYAERAEAGRMRLFSVRNENGKAHVTISTEAFKGSFWEIDQIKGKQNQPPVPRYINAVRTLLNREDLRHDDHPDCFDMGLFFQDGKTITFNEIDDEILQKKLLFRNPDLIAICEDVTPVMAWLALLRKPRTIKFIEKPDIAMQAFAQAADPFTLDMETAQPEVKGLLADEAVYELDGEPIIIPRLFLGTNS